MTDPADRLALVAQTATIYAAVYAAASKPTVERAEGWDGGIVGRPTATSLEDRHGAALRACKSWLAWAEKEALR